MSDSSSGDKNSGSSLHGALRSEARSTRSATFPASFESLDEVRNYVAELARAQGFEQADIYAVQLAVDEAFTNIIEHAYGGESQEVIECTCQADEQCLTITLLDYGEPFDPSDIPEPDLDSNLEERQVGGLGLYFMNQLMDEVQFTFVPQTKDGKGYNVLKMVKRKEK
jgi:serine/threonine-protein kinase RsbW